MTDGMLIIIDHGCRILLEHSEHEPSDTHDNAGDNGSDNQPERKPAEKGSRSTWKIRNGAERFQNPREPMIKAEGDRNRSCQWSTWEKPNEVENDQDDEKQESGYPMSHHSALGRRARRTRTHWVSVSSDRANPSRKATASLRRGVGC